MGASMKGLAMVWAIIALAFPLLEILAIVRLWQDFGYWTLAWLLAAVFAGMALIALERVAFLPGLAASVLAGQHPLQALKVSGLRFLAAILLIIPGPISDVAALLLLLWGGFRPAPRPVERPPVSARSANEEIIEGEYRRIE